MQIIGKVGNSTPASSETPELIVTYICMGDYVTGILSRSYGS